MKLPGLHPSTFTRKVRIVLAEKKIDYDFVIASPQAEGSPVPAHNPLGKVPVLVLDDETAVYDSRVIVEFLDSVSPFGRLIPPGNREGIEHQTGKIRAGVAGMNRELGDKPYCTGNTYTLADIATGVCLGYLDFRFPQFGWRDSLPNLVRLDAKLAERQSFIDTIPRDWRGPMPARTVPPRCRFTGPAAPGGAPTGAC